MILVSSVRIRNPVTTIKNSIFALEFVNVILAGIQDTHRLVLKRLPLLNLNERRSCIRERSVQWLRRNAPEGLMISDIIKKITEQFIVVFKSQFFCERCGWFHIQKHKYSMLFDWFPILAQQKVKKSVLTKKLFQLHIKRKK